VAVSSDGDEERRERRGGRAEGLASAILAPRVLAVLFVLACVPVALAVFAVPYVPTHDGPKTLYAAHVRAHLDEPGYASEFQASRPLTTVGFPLVYAVFERLTGWRLAYAIAMLLTVVAIPIAVLALARAFDRRRAPLALFAVAGAFTWSVHMGFVGFVGSVGIGLGAIAVAIGSPRWSIRRELGVYALCLAATVFHPVGGQIACASIFVLRVLTSERGRRLREIGATAIGCAPTVAVTLLTKDALDELAQKGIIQRDYLDLSFAERLLGLRTCFMSGPLYRGLPLLALGAAGIAFVVGDAARRRWDRRAVAVAVVAALGVGGTLLSPMNDGVWQLVQPRFIVLWVFTGLALIPLERASVRARALTTVVGLGLALASNGWIAAEHARFFRETPAAAGAFGAKAEKGRTLLPIVTLEETLLDVQRDETRTFAHAAFMLNVGQLVAVDRDAVSPYTFSVLPNVHLVESKLERMPRVPRRDYAGFFLPHADPAARRAELVRLASFGTAFDDVFFVGDDADIDRLVALGYEPERRGRGFMLGHLVGCPVRVELRGLSARAALHVEWLPSDRRVETFEIGPAGPVLIEVARASCGGIGVRLESVEGKLRCAEAREDGLLLVGPRVARVVCDVVAGR